MFDETSLAPPPGHSTVDDELLHLQLGRSFLAGPHADESILQLRWYRRDEDGALVGRVWWGPGAQGPPGHAHGGSLAAVLDEALGSACWIAGHSVVAAEIQVTFHDVLPLGHTYDVVAWVDGVDGRKVRTSGYICNAEGKRYTSATGLFVTMPVEKFHALAEPHSS